MNIEHERGWSALKQAEACFTDWATDTRIPLECIHYVAAFEAWNKKNEVYVFVDTDLDLKKFESDGTLRRIEVRFLDLLVSANYPFEKWPLLFIFDSHENVVKNYEGNYFYRLR